MRISHPQAPYQGIPAEDVFFVANDQGIQMGLGYVIMFYQHELYPEQPQHIFMQIEAQPSARCLLYGALIARAEQMRVQTPHLNARLYAQVAPDDVDMMNFYSKNGFKNDDGEDMFVFPLPQGPAYMPMGCQLASVPLRNEQEQLSFLARLNAYRIPPITLDYLTVCMQQQHFMALGLYRGSQPLCECLITGAGKQATLVEMYTVSQYRRQKFARSLLTSAASILQPQGVDSMVTHIFRRNVPQVSMMRAMQGTFVRTVTAFPGLTL